jgi:hypothetical protein
MEIQHGVPFQSALPLGLLVTVLALPFYDHGPGLDRRHGKSIKHLAEHASPPLLAFGTEVMQSVPHHESP